MTVWSKYFTGDSSVALDATETPKVQRAQQIIDDLREPDADEGYPNFISPDDPRLSELEDIVDSLTPEVPDSESDFERVAGGD